MNGNIFIDTSILVYAYSVTEPDKRVIAREVLSGGHIFISTQVLQEFADILNKKFKINWEQVLDVLDECEKNFNIFTNTDHTIAKACLIARDYDHSFYDSLLIAAALQTDSHVIYSEHMLSDYLIEDKLKIINPFV